MKGSEIKGLSSRVCQIIYIESIDSTQEEAKRLYREGKLCDGTIIWAGEQTCGRGRHGKKWISPQGRGLWFTFAFRPKLEGNELNLLSLVTALAVVDALSELGLNALVKWPNDVLLSGKKVCGILIEGLFNGRELDYCLLGVGLNLRDISDVPDSTSLESEIGFPVKEEVILSIMINNIFRELESLWFRKKEVLSRYKSICINLGREIVFKREGKLFKGEALDINDDGRLIVKVDDNLELLCSEVVESVR
ncbi:MAG: biotin--[acetyl-CoA-carboxylase] ligase [Synergistetes bacterium]|nr:biotin--[acetyl-CoA-carboxylase] ligase [Synergistota bacterium]MCX8127855.1 biotin--[acetyl-CoA-carboxylase] ligase [Synergistota bacterium]MDW8192117.1 biotin--[acetyl-CoA-carboxylase] ligase [Synergistota bacterium]